MTSLPQHQSNNQSSTPTATAKTAPKTTRTRKAAEPKTAPTTPAKAAPAAKSTPAKATPKAAPATPTPEPKAAPAKTAAAPAPTATAVKAERAVEFMKKNPGTGYPVKDIEAGAGYGIKSLAGVLARLAATKDSGVERVDVQRGGRIYKGFMFKAPTSK